MFVCSTLHCPNDQQSLLFNRLLFNQENKLYQIVMEKINIEVLFWQSRTPHGEDIPVPMTIHEDCEI